MSNRKQYEIKLITEDIRIMTYKFFLDLVLVGVILGGMIYIVKCL